MEINSKILIVDSDFAKTEIKSILKLKEKKIFKVYLGINEKYFENKESSEFIESFNYHESYILSVLSCVKYHNIINLLKAYKMLLNDISTPPKFCLICSNRILFFWSIWQSNRTSVFRR